MDSRHLPRDHRSHREPGTAYWLTGLPGVGKKTLATALTTHLMGTGRPVIQLDGDRMRELLGGRFGYSQADRRAVSQIYSALSHELAGQGHDVVFATVSMFHQIRCWNRANIVRYREVYLRTTIETLVRRHPKGLYAAALAGRIRNVPGVDLPIEEPDAADIIIDDDGVKSPEAIAAEVIERLRLAEPPEGPGAAPIYRAPSPACGEVRPVG